MPPLVPLMLFNYFLAALLRLGFLELFFIWFLSTPALCTTHASSMTSRTQACLLAMSMSTRRKSATLKCRSPSGLRSYCRLFRTDA